MMFALAAFVAPASALAAQAEASGCELHVWPTVSHGAVFHGATLGSVLSGNLAGEVSPRDSVQRSLAATATSDFQNQAIEQLGLGSMTRFSGHRIVLHEAPVAPKFGNWIDRDIGAGGRESDSTAACYAELHVVFITHFKTMFSKQIQTGFVFREFGPSGPATGWAAHGSSSRAPAFPSRRPEDDAQAATDLRNAFQQNVRDFIASRSMRPNRIRRPRSPAT